MIEEFSVDFSGVCVLLFIQANSRIRSFSLLKIPASHENGQTLKKGNGHRNTPDQNSVRLDSSGGYQPIILDSLCVCACGCVCSFISCLNVYLGDKLIGVEAET